MRELSFIGTKNTTWNCFGNLKHCMYNHTLHKIGKNNNTSFKNILTFYKTFSHKTARWFYPHLLAFRYTAETDCLSVCIRVRRGSNPPQGTRHHFWFHPLQMHRVSGLCRLCFTSTLIILFWFTWKNACTCHIVKKMGEFGGQNAHSTLYTDCESGV